MSNRPPRIVTEPYKIATWRQVGNRPSNWFDLAPFWMVPVTKFKEVIISDDSPSRSVKSCFHYKWSQLNQAQRFEGTDNFGYQVGYSDIIDYDPLPKILEIWAANWRPYQVDWDRVVQSYIPSLRNQFNLINFAWEAGEMRDLFDSFRRILSNPREIYRRAGFTRSLDSPNGYVFRPSGVADSYLEGTFGILPLDADLRAIADTVQNYGERLGRITAQLTRGISAKIRNVTEGAFTEDIYVYGVGSEAPYSATLSFDYSIIECVGCKVRGHMPRDPIREYLDYIGFYPDLSTLWNAVPFSFLVDYVVPVGQALEPGPWLSPTISTSDGFYSTKIVGNWSIRVNGWHGNWFTPDSGYTNPSLLIAGGPFSLYAREPIFVDLDGIDLPSLSAPNLRQSANIAALVTAFRGR